MHHSLRLPLLLAAAVPLLLSGCVEPGPYYGPPPAAAPSVVFSPTVYPGYGYGYWYGGRFCAYRNGYYFHNGSYYRGGYRGGYYNQGYRGYHHWNNGYWYR